MLDNGRIARALYRQDLPCFAERVFGAWRNNLLPKPRCKPGPIVDVAYQNRAGNSPKPVGGTTQLALSSLVSRLAGNG
jgi:hypothetical protein